MLQLFKWINGTSVSILLFSLYFGYTAHQMYSIMFPKFVLQPDDPFLGPLWNEGQLMDGECYISSRATWEVSDFTSSRVVLVGMFRDLTFDWKDNERSIDLNISIHDQRESNSTKRLPNAMWKRIRNNETVYLHVHLTQRGASPDPRKSNYHKLRTLHQVTPLTKFSERRNLKNSKRLLNFFWNSSLTNVEPKNEPIVLPGELHGDDPALTSDIISYWKPHMAVRIVTCFKKYPIAEVPHLVFHNLRMEHVENQGWRYLPVMYVDEMGLTSEKLINLNRSVTELPLKLSYEPMSYARWQMMMTFENALRQQKELGFGDDEIDNMRSMIADTNPYLLAVTMAVSMLHILFDWLAFKSDIAFWQQNESLIGISVRSMFTSLISQTIVFLYLMEQQTTLLVLVPSGISIVIQVWKIGRATSPKFSVSWRTIIKVEFTRSQAEGSSETDEIDTLAMTYMGFILYPVLIGYPVFSLLYQDHTSFYSWILGSLTGFVYTFGFITMTPQLYLNYKLKSVAHLPWRFLIYRALNTFIDDLFAFIIQMPTMHRISCFRDDIIFFIYLYQRWIYPVDNSRRHEDLGEHAKQE
ncbi:Cleft lip and palate associated transmembrane protein 1 [Aphanomyces cochlioides]|nr:Cleft lip and palate associated transmembrane protein 1 [Aphanomyces cochlioides]